METIEFNQLIEKVKKENPMLFCLESDCKANITKIEMIENYYGIVLPKSYKEFLMQYGGGYFAYTIVYSADDESPYYLISNVDKQFSKNRKYLPVFDFETGDLAGFRIEDGVCEDSILIYDHEEDKISDTGLDFYTTLVKYGLKLSKM